MQVELYRLSNQVTQVKQMESELRSQFIHQKSQLESKV